MVRLLLFFNIPYRYDLVLFKIKMSKTTEIFTSRLQLFAAIFGIAIGAENYKLAVTY